MRPTIDLAETARRHLSPDVAAAWIKLLRPAIQLSSDSGRGAVVGCLGGQPSLPEDLAWPEWPGKGPLSLVATLDCAALSVIDGLPMPDAGTLLFFYFDGQYDDAAALVYCGDPASKAGAQVLYIPEDTPTTLRRTPEGIVSYPTVELRASIIETTASYDHFVIQDAFPQMATADLNHQISSDAFVDALDLGYHFGHQLGGHALPIQGPVEYEAAQFALGGVDWRSDTLRAEAARWQLLAQFTSDSRADMMWGDGGFLYWLIKPEDLAARRFERAEFTWQCS